MKKLGYCSWGGAQEDSQPCKTPEGCLMYMQEASTYTVGQGQQPFINTQEHPDPSELHLLLCLRVTESTPPVSCCVRVATHAGCYHQHFTSCYKFSLALCNATCFIKLFRVLRSSGLTRSSREIAPSVAAFTHPNSAGLFA